MSIELVVSQWGDAIDATLRERLPELEIVAIPRGVPQVFPMRPHVFLALPIKTEDRQKQLSLAAVDEFLEQSAVPRGHRPVTDFQLLCEPHLRMDVENIVESWSGRHFGVAPKVLAD